MSKKVASSSLGRALIKNQKRTNRGRKHTGDQSLLHTTEIPDGYDWGRLNLQSVTEESSFQDFLSTAELASSEFQTEKLNITFVNPTLNIGLSTAEIKKIKDEHERNKGALTIPRRPKWSPEMSASEVQNNEREEFLEWRRKLAVLQEQEGLLMTPYEKNLEFWRQLWRVVERSDVVVQIVDARNPLLFRCEDLERYVKEVSPDKMNLLLINKADFLTEKQREIWRDYFSKLNIKIIFFSAVLAAESLKTITEEPNNDTDNLENISEIVEKFNLESNKENEFNSAKILNREELISFFKSIHVGPKVTPGLTTIGLVGYPNVGKSSTINTIMTEKKVSVSATPGKTKHFQTLFLDQDLQLCDCPGLVMPSFVVTKAEMILNGILPIDQMRDHVPAVTLLASLIPRHVLEDKYGIMIPKNEDDPEKCPTSEELLNAYGYNRGFMTANGQPDNPRSARYILKDFVNGRLLYATAPPGMKQDEFHHFPERLRNELDEKVLPPRQIRATKLNKISSVDFDKGFFDAGKTGIHIRGVHGKTGGLPSQKILSDSDQIIEKPWKKINKHVNKKKREKARRLYAHLDEH